MPRGSDAVIADIRLRHPELVLTETLQTVDISVELEYQSLAGSGAYYLFFSVYDGDFDAFDAAVADDPTVAESRVTVDADEFRVYRILLTSTEHLVLPEAANLGMRVLYAEGADDGGWLATLEVPELEALHRFREHCADRDVAFSVERLYRADDERGAEYGLTSVQRETLVTAYERGYFEAPRETSIDQLGEALEVSSSAVSGRLRRGMRNLVENTLL